MKIFFIFFLLLISVVYADWQKPPSVDPLLWEEVAPYFLSFEHPAKAKLDKVFAKQNVLANEKSFLDKGFHILPLRRWDNIYVAWHSKLKGLVVKTYLDSQVGISYTYAFKRRVTGALSIDEAINAFGYQDNFTVPKKWIYPLPNPSQEGLQPKNFILIAEDIKLLSPKENLKKWKRMDRPKLKALFHIISTLGLNDSIYPTNLPFTKEGKIAFIDTEHHHNWPIRYERLKSFLNEEMANYWQQLIDTNGQAE